MTSMTLAPPLTNPPSPELVAGVDTHKNTHHVAILDLVGRPVADRKFRADGRGYALIVAFLHTSRRCCPHRGGGHGVVWGWSLARADRGAADRRRSRATGPASPPSHFTMQAEIDLIEQQLEMLVRQVNPTLLSLSGVGPVTGATLLVAAGDNPERLGTRASFAALTGVAPIPASSGQRRRHRLSRGGNWHANAALHRIVLLRMRHREPRTMAYCERRRAEQLTDRDIMRCLKRHIANEVYAALLNPATGNPVGRELRARRQAIGIPISVLATTYQRLRRLEIGTRADPELEHRANLALDEISPPQTA